MGEKTEQDWGEPCADYYFEDEHDAELERKHGKHCHCGAEAVVYSTVTKRNEAGRVVSETTVPMCLDHMEF